MKPRCIISGAEADMCHILTKKAHPELREAPWNLIPMNRIYHNLQHAKGWYFMYQKYPAVRKWLDSHGWEFTDSFGQQKLYRPKHEKKSEDPIVNK